MGFTRGQLPEIKPIFIYIEAPLDDKDKDWVGCSAMHKLNIGFNRIAEELPDFVRLDFLKNQNGNGRTFEKKKH